MAADGLVRGQRERGSSPGLTLGEVPLDEGDDPAAGDLIVSGDRRAALDEDCHDDHLRYCARM
jgi:hypothetical protein